MSCDIEKFSSKYRDEDLGEYNYVCIDVKNRLTN